MSPLSKPVTRRSEVTKRSAGKLLRIVVTMYPDGYLGLRLERSRKEETIALAAVYDIAVKQRVAWERSQKAKAKKEARK